MEEKTQDMDALVEKLGAKEKKRRRNALYYLALPVLAGLVLTLWTGKQADTIGEQVKTIDKQTVEKAALEDSASILQIQLVQTRQATKYIQAGLDSFYGGNYSAAIRQYDKAIALDSLNPVVLELKSESLLKKGEAQEASKIIDKAVQADSVQVKQVKELQRTSPEARRDLKASEAWKKIMKIKPDSQDVIRRKLKARELKRR